MDTPGPLGGDMASVAARIRERANILLAERQTLKDASDRLAALEGEHLREQKINDMRRRHLLEVTNARNEVEIDIFTARDEIQDMERAIVECEKEEQECDGRGKQAKDENTDTVETIYGPKLFEMELYVRSLRDTIQAKEDNIQHRLDRLAAIRARCESVVTEEESFRQEARLLDEETKKLSQALPSASDDVITNLSKRIRQTINERTELRKKLKDARDENSKANEEYMVWEEKRISLTTGGS